MDKIERWMNDMEGPPKDKWTANRFYRKALELNITDPRQVANALTLLDAVERAAKRNPNVSYDALVDIILLGLEPGERLTFPNATRLQLGKLYVKHWWRRVCRLYFDPIRRLRRQP